MLCTLEADLSRAPVRTLYKAAGKAIFRFVDIDIRSEEHTSELRHI